MTFDIRGPWLKPGRYTVDVFVCQAGVLDAWEGAGAFEVLPVLPYPQSDGGEAHRGRRRAGRLRAEGRDPVKTTVIRPPRRIDRPSFRELWEAREVLYRFGQRDVLLRYRQTAIGVVWVVLQPLLAAGGVRRRVRPGRRPAERRGAVLPVRLHRHDRLDLPQQPDDPGVRLARRQPGAWCRRCSSPGPSCRCRRCCRCCSISPSPSCSACSCSSATA